jgi:Transcriptional regulator
MNIQQLRVVVELSKGKSLIEIGEALEITQPTVSFHIRKLEEESGMPLFIKEKRNLTLTKACQELVPYAKQILSLLDEAKQKMALANEIDQPRLRITASHSPATYFLPPYLQQFQRNNPDIEVSIAVNQARKSIQLLKDHQADLAIISLQSFTVEGLNIHPIKEDKLLLTYAPTNRLASLSDITLDDLSKETFLLHEEGSTSRIVTNNWAKQTGLSMPHTMELSSIETIKEGVKAGMGIGILPEMGIRKELDAGELLAIPLPQYEYRRCICLAYRNEEQISEFVNSFIWFAMENMK